MKKYRLLRQIPRTQRIGPDSKDRLVTLAKYYTVHEAMSMKKSLEEKRDAMSIAGYPWRADHIQVPFDVSIYDTFIVEITR